MPPRYLQRMQRQSDVLRDVFGDPQNDPPPYPFSPSRAGSSSSSFQYRRSADLSAYHFRYSQDSSSYHQRQDSSQSSAATSLHYRQSDDAGSSEGTSYHFPPPPGYTQATTTPTGRDSSFATGALPRDSLVLVTGANSYLGQHIVDQLLAQGFRVRGTVRTAEKAISTAKFFGDRYGAGRYTTAVIPDMAALHAFDLAVRGCAGVMHVASVTTPSADPHEVITPSIAGALNALEAASKEPGVRRVMFTSCVGAAVGCERGVRDVVGGDSWNMVDFERAWGPPTYGEMEGEADPRSRVEAVRASSKMQAEQAVWKWYWERRPGFVLNSVLPDTLWGAPLCSPYQQNHDQQQYNQPDQPDQRQQETPSLPPSIALLSSLLLDQPTSTLQTSGHFVSVLDAATLHLAALLFPDVRNERVFAVSIPWTQRSVRELIPQHLAGRLKSGDRELVNAPDCGRGPSVDRDSSREEDESMDLTVFKDVERAEELLIRMGKPGWRDLEGSLRGAVEGFAIGGVV